MNITTIQLGILHLNSCLELDQKALKGLWNKSQWERELTDSKRVCIGVIDIETKKLLVSGFLLFCHLLNCSSVLCLLFLLQTFD